MSKDNEASIVIERTYKARIEELWDLWTTKDGFESWWGPQGFRVDVHALEARPQGALHYDMIADTPEMIAAMKEMGRPASHETHGTFTQVRPHERLVIAHVIDFLPGVEPYDSIIEVGFRAVSEGRARMTITLSPMHDIDTTRMQEEGFTSQLSKLDQRYGWQG